MNLKSNSLASITGSALQYFDRCSITCYSDSLLSVPRVLQFLATVVPSFLKLSRKDAFLEAVASQNLSDQILQTAVIEFLATWRPWTWARVSDLEADPQVAAVTDQLLPETLTLVEWLALRMQQDTELDGNGNKAYMYFTAYARPGVMRAYNLIFSCEGNHHALRPSLHRES